MEKLIDKLSEHIIEDFRKSELLSYYVVEDKVEIIIDKDEMKISFKYVLIKGGTLFNYVGIHSFNVDKLSRLIKNLERLLESSFDDKIFEDELGYYHIKIFSKEITVGDNFGAVEIHIVLSYELYSSLTLYYDILPKELLLKILSSPNVNYNEEIKLLSIFNIDTNDKSIVIFLIKNRYPSIYKIIRELNLLSNVSIKLYEELIEFQDHIERHVYVDNYNEDKFISDIFKMVTNSGDFQLEDTDSIIITLILYKIFVRIYNIISTEEYFKNKMQEVLKDIITMYDETDKDDGDPGTIFKFLELSDAIYNFVEHADIYDPKSESLLYLELDIVTITKSINEHPLLWIFLLSIDLSNLLVDQNIAATKIISRLRGIDTKEYSFSNKFLNKIRSENKRLYDELNHI